MATATPPITTSVVNQASSIWPVPYMRRYISWALPPMFCALWLTEPKISPKPSSATRQPKKAGRCSRHTSPAARGAPRRRGRAPARSGSTPADVAPDGEPAGDRDQGARERGEQDEQPPVVAAERPHLLAPSDRRQPGRPGAGRAAPPRPRRRACCRAPLSRNDAPSTARRQPAGAARRATTAAPSRAPTPVKTMPTTATAAPAASEPATGCPPTTIAPPSSSASTTSAADRDDDRRGQARGVAPDHARAEQLGPAGSSFCRVCRTTADHAHHGGQHRQRDVGRGASCSRRRSPQREAQHAHAGVADHELRLSQDVRLARQAVREHGGGIARNPASPSSQAASMKRSRRSASRTRRAVPVKPFIRRPLASIR